jgi:serine phosphatase RsbU (regulator of sigma subunit)
MLSRATGQQAAARDRTDALVGLHLLRTAAELRAHARDLLEDALGDRSAALLIDEGDGRARVEIALGACPLAEGACVSAADWPARLQMPIPYRNLTVGALLIDAPLEDLEKPVLRQLLAHLGAALVNLHLGAEARQSTELYCASLQAFEEGVVLFQEHDPQAVGARFMSLLTTMLGSPIGALLVLERIGDLASPLRVDQCVGFPETLLQALVAPSGSWWPPTLLASSAQVLARAADGRFTELDDTALPPMLRNIVACPLRYHGVVAGLCLVFNAPIDEPAFAAKLDSARRLAELGAALFHRLSLEREALRNRHLQTQLEIAATIQARLLPREAPDCPSLECAWRSKPAQNIGGDYLDLLTNELGDAFAVIADVSGHGIDSALLMTSFRSTYRADCKDLPPDTLMAALNTEVADEVGPTGMFITAASFHIRRDGRKLTYASAGHNPVLLYRAVNGALQELDSTGPSLGFFRDSEYDRVELALHPGDVLLLYTDGVVEEVDDSGEMFDVDRLRKCLAANVTRPASDILNAIYRTLREFTGRDSTQDDVSVSVIKIL